MNGGVRRAGVLVFLATFAVALGGAAFAAAAPLRATGTVEGSLDTKSTLRVRLTVVDAKGWQDIDTIALSLELRHRPLDLLQISPSASTLGIVGFGPPARLGQTGLLLGAFFKIDPSRVTTSARGTTFTLTAPVHLLADPPAGARLTLAARDDLGNATGQQKLTPPVQENSGFSWATLGLAIVVALFAGGFVGRTVSGRGRPAPAFSVYDAIRRRMGTSGVAAP